MEFGFSPVQSEPACEPMLHIARLMNFGKPDLDRVEASLRRFGEQVLPHCAAL